MAITCYHKSRVGKHLGNPRQKLNPTQRTIRERKQSSGIEWSDQALLRDAKRQAKKWQESLQYPNGKYTPQRK